jgi:hypothetical protein
MMAAQLQLALIVNPALHAVGTVTHVAIRTTITLDFTS